MERETKENIAVIAFIIIVIISAVLTLTSCKSVKIEETVETTYPDGKVERRTKKMTDDSFTLGGSEGDGKTLLELSVGNVGM